MEMHQVRYFLAVAETLNFTRAAEQCNVAQPSLTRAIQKLEEELGGLLFHRERQNTHLTELGRLMLPHLARTHEAAQSARALARGIRAGDRVPLRIGVGAGLCVHRVVELLVGLRDTVGGVEITLRQAPEPDICSRALEGEFDIVFVSEPGPLPDRLHAWRLFVEADMLILPNDHPLAARSEIDFGDLNGEELVDLAGLAGDPEGQPGAGPRIRHRVSSPIEMQVMIRSGFGLGIVPKLSGCIEGVVQRPLAGVVHERAVMVAVVAGRPFNRATDACLKLARSRDWRLPMH